MEREGIKAGDPVALIVNNSEEFIIALFAIGRIGAVAIPLNTYLKAEEFVYILNDCNATLLLASAATRNETAALREKTAVRKTVWVDACDVSGEADLAFDTALQTEGSVTAAEPGLDDLAVVIYTSGTTGHPKGAMLSYRNIFSNMVAAKERFDISPRDRFIVYLPMFHAFTLTVTVLLPIFNRSPLVVVRSILPFANIIKQVLLKRVTIFVGVPDIYKALIRAKLPWYFMWFNRLRILVSGASALPYDTLEKYAGRFKRATLLEGYGLSECSPAVAVNPLQKQKPRSVGTALAGYEAKVVDEEMMEVPCGKVGELIVKGDCVMQGYLNRPEATEATIQNGWLLTGDFATMDEEGYIYIVDRKKDLIISKGQNIYPREIEEHLHAHPGILAAAVVGLNDPNSGEVPVAFIEKEEGAELGSHDIRAYLKPHLANFKLPHHVFFVDELPKNATGKVLKRKLKEEMAAYMSGSH